MSYDTITFGRAIAKARKKKGLSQKELAALIEREAGAPISPQYLNDIEHDRRSPSSDHLVSQFAEDLNDLRCCLSRAEYYFRKSASYLAMMIYLCKTDILER